MTISEKMVAVAENLPRVYEAGKTAGIKSVSGKVSDISLNAFEISGDQEYYRVSDNEIIISGTIEPVTIHCAGETIGFTYSVLNYSGRNNIYIIINGEMFQHNAEEYVENGELVADNIVVPMTYMESDIVICGGMTNWFFTDLKEQTYLTYEDGRKHEYDRMWDVLQPEGKISYQTGSGFFGGALFNVYNFYPKRDIKPEGNASMLFYAWETVNHALDLKNRLKECGVTLDTSKATNLTSAFNHNIMDNLPTIDCTGLTTACTGVFANAYGYRKTIEKIIVNESVTYYNWFYQSTGLENIVIEGVIGQSGFDIHWSKNLTAKSILSILTALSKDSTVASGKSVTFASASKSVIEGNAECLHQYNLAINAGWNILYA